MEVDVQPADASVVVAMPPDESIEDLPEEFIPAPLAESSHGSAASFNISANFSVPVATTEETLPDESLPVVEPDFEVNLAKYSIVTSGTQRGKPMLTDDAGYS